MLRDGGKIRSITTEDGAEFRAAVFADATYEGDLMAQSGVSYTLGRESTREYGESLAGVRPKDRGHQFDVRVAAYERPAGFFRRSRRNREETLDRATGGFRPTTSAWSSPGTATTRRLFPSRPITIRRAFSCSSACSRRSPRKRGVRQGLAKWFLRFRSRAARRTSTTTERSRPITSARITIIPMGRTGAGRDSGGSRQLHQGVLLFPYARWRRSGELTFRGEPVGAVEGRVRGRGATGRTSCTFARRGAWWAISS